MKTDHNYSVKTNASAQTTKKMDCKTRILMRDIVFFPDFKAKEDKKHYRAKTASNLQGKLDSVGISEVKYERKFVVTFPKFIMVILLEQGSFS